MSRRVAVIAGAGPAGLTAALQLLRETDVVPLVFEMEDCVGGISQTVDYNGYRMDLGGHRFFSKSDWVMDWWQQVLPIERSGDGSGHPTEIAYHNQKRDLRVSNEASEPDGERVMLVRNRLSRIYYLRRFFDYPVKLNWNTVSNLGMRRMSLIGFSYMRAKLAPIRPEKSLEDFLINRFGRRLYLTFFKDYTEKVWGIPCVQISSEWGAQRIKGLSVSKALTHALMSLLPGRKDRSLSQMGTATSLIERFLYPKYGPGQMWQEVAVKVREGGGTIRLRHRVEKVFLTGRRVVRAQVRDLENGVASEVSCDYFFSTMPVRELILNMAPRPSREVLRIASGLQYRDFITIGLLVSELKVSAGGKGLPRIIPDNWIYIQDAGIKLGRLQIFNNWSPFLVKDPSKVWLGLEYFCSRDDEIWKMPDAELTRFAVEELARIELIDPSSVLDSHVKRVPKAYPGYFGSYSEFDVLRGYADSIPNLFLIGRNGMHRYNNQDHSMLTAKAAVDAVARGDDSKESIWKVNVGDDYHEEKSSSG